MMATRKRDSGSADPFGATRLEFSGEKLRKAREARGWSLTKLGAAILIRTGNDFSPSTLSAAELGKTTPTGLCVLCLLLTLDLTPQQLCVEVAQ